MIFALSKARDDFPEPLNPVITTSLSRGISTWRFFRLCWRAPLILITCAGILTRNVEPFSQAQAHFFSTEFRPFMSETARELTPEDFAELQKRFSEIKHSINNELAVMMALSEMSHRRPDYAEKLATTVLSKAPQIVSSLQEFTQALNDKFGSKPEGVSESK